MVDSEARSVLVIDIRKMGWKHSIAYLDLIQGHHPDGTEKGPITVNAHAVYQECHLPVTWPVAEVRELWKRTIQILPTLQSGNGDGNSGFTDWLWTQIQRTWHVTNERGFAIDPFTMWQSVLITGHAGEQVFCSKPLQATAMEVSLMARRAGWVAENAQQIETDAVHQQEISRASWQVQADSTLEPNTYESRLINSRATLDLESYRKAEMLRVRLRNWAEAVANYELMLLPESAKKRPTGSEFTADLIQHFRSCSVELSRHANSMTTSRSLEGKPAGAPKAVTQATGGKRGRRKGTRTTDESKDLEIAEEWNRFKGPGGTRKEFAESKCMSVKKLKQAIDRVAVRARRHK